MLYSKRREDVMQQHHLSRRSFLQLSAIGAATTVVAACMPAPAGGPAAASGPAQSKVTITWWDFPRGWAPPGTTEAPNAWNEEIAKKYMAENPNVTIEFTGVSWGDGPQKLDVALAANEGPNLMYGYPALFGKMLSLDALAPIDDYVATLDEADVKDFFPPAWEFATVNGKKWAWPWYYSSEG